MDNQLSTHYHYHITFRSLTSILTLKYSYSILLISENEMASPMPKLANTIHIRDFIDDVLPDSSRPNAPNCVEIHSNINIFPEDEFYDLNVVVEPIHTCIRTYLKQTERSLYTPNAFFYVDGRFVTALNPEGNLEITVYALSIERYTFNTNHRFMDY